MPTTLDAEPVIEATDSSSDRLRNRISKFLPDELRKALTEKKLPTTGSNEELVDRLVRALSRSDDIHQIIPETKTQRIKGYCVHWQGDAGIVINQDTGKEYRVNTEDIVTVDRALLHTLEPVEFSADGDRAIRVTKPGGKKVQYLWRKSSRRGRDPPAGEKRYLGYVERFDNQHGFIVFKEANFRDVYFPVHELHVTGVKIVPLGAEVEFQIGSKNNAKKQAQRITRAGGGLITNELGMLGKFLRDNNTNLEEKQEIEVEEDAEGIVMSGIVGEWFPRTESGIIWPMNGCKTITCKASEVVSTGLKLLRSQTEVEFTAIQENGQVVATKVTGPGGIPIVDAAPGPVHDYLSKLGKTFEEQAVLDVDPVQKLRGWVKTLTNNDEFGYIQPNIPGSYRHIEFTYHQINWTGPGFPHIPLNEELEFSTCAWDDGTVRAIKISRVGGEPFELSPEEAAERERLVTQRQGMGRTPPPTKKKEVEADIQVEVKSENATETDGKISDSKKRKNESDDHPAKRKKTNNFDKPVPARPRPKSQRALLGIIVDFNLPSMKGILQPLRGIVGGNCKELLGFDMSSIQCDAFRGVDKWSTVEFTLVEGVTTEAKEEGAEPTKVPGKAEYVTSPGNQLIQFDESTLLQRESWMIEAHTMKYTAPPAVNRGPQGNWQGNVHPFPGHGMPHFPPPMMFGGGHRGGWRRGGWRGGRRGRGFRRHRGRRGRGRRGRGRW